jgi:hypothetical protein
VEERQSTELEVLMESIDRLVIQRIALEAQLDPRTVKRALENGIESLQSAFSKARLRDALKKLKREDLIK